MPLAQRVMLMGIIKTLSISSIERYDFHFEVVLKAIKMGDLEQLDKFYQYYDLNPNHPLRILLNRLVEPIPEQLGLKRYEGVNSSDLITVTVYNKEGEIIGYLDENTGFIKDTNSDNTDDENKLELVPYVIPNQE